MNTLPESLEIIQSAPTFRLGGGPQTNEKTVSTGRVKTTLAWFRSNSELAARQGVASQKVFARGSTPNGGENLPFPPWLPQSCCERSAFGTYWVLAVSRLANSRPRTQLRHIATRLFAKVCAPWAWAKLICPPAKLIATETPIVTGSPASHLSEPPAPSAPGATQRSERVSAVVVLPGPMTGMTIATAKVISALQAAGPVRIYDLSMAATSKGWKWRLAKSFKTLFAAWKILTWPREPGELCYLVPNAARGLWQTWLLTFAAKLRGFRVALHHHVFSYFSSRSWLMARVQKLLGPRDVNVLLAADMVEPLRRHYASQARELIVPNGYLLDSMAETTSHPAMQRPLSCLGHISNLSLEKGLDLVIETFARLKDHGHSVRLRIAGPLAGRREQEIMKEAQRRFPDDLDYLGPVYGEQKEQFLASVDVMLFPTRYPNEAQPLVICEALAHASPVIAYGRGCIPSLLPAGGIVIPPAEDFTGQAVNVIEQWIKSPEDFAQYRAAAFEVAQKFQVLSHEALGNLLDEVRKSCVA
jgi:glycosyltransferase involved in cell wall biosynthesis